MKFSPEVVVNVGSSGRRLTDSFSVMYSVKSEEAFSQLINETSPNIHSEELFDMFLVSGYKNSNFLKAFIVEKGL